MSDILIVRAHKFAKQDPDESTHAIRYNAYVKGALDERKLKRQWIKIDRDENGFATEECLREIEACYEKEIPVAIAYVSYGTDYDVISSSSDIQGWLADIHNSAKYTHYLPIPKLEV